MYHFARGMLLSDHPHPYPVLHWLGGALSGFGVLGGALAVVGMVVMALAYDLPLLPVVAVLLAILLVPLVQVAVVHPRVTAYEFGLWIKPVAWRGRFVPWRAIRRLEEHTLIRRGTTRARDREHFGQLIVADGLPWPYAAVAWMGGVGWRARAFGISTRSHRDYDRLLATIHAHVVSRGA